MSWRVATIASLEYVSLGLPACTRFEKRIHFPIEKKHIRRGIGDVGHDVLNVWMLVGYSTVYATCRDQPRQQTSLVKIERACSLGVAAHRFFQKSLLTCR